MGGFELDKVIIQVESNRPTDPASYPFQMRSDNFNTFYATNYITFKTTFAS
jgi:hypothetical protein